MCAPARALASGCSDDNNPELRALASASDRLRAGPMAGGDTAARGFGRGERSWRREATAAGTHCDCWSCRLSALRSARRGGSILAVSLCRDGDGGQRAASSARRASQHASLIPGFRTHLRDVQNGLMQHSQ